MNLSFQVFDLPLKHTFTIAHQSRDVQETLIVRLEEGGIYGLGESTSNPFYGITIENMSACLEEFRPVVKTGKWNRPEELWELGREVFKNNPFAQSIFGSLKSILKMLIAKAVPIKTMITEIIF